MPQPIYQVWVNSSQLPNEDVTRISFTRARSDIFNRLSVGAAQIELVASTGKYTVGSERVFINQPVNIRAVDGSSVYNLFTGYVEGYDIDPSLDSGQKLNLRCGDIVSKLRNTIQTSLQYLVTQQAVFANVLAASGLTSSQYVMATFPDTVVFAYMDQITAGEAIFQTQQSGAHYSYVDGYGRLNIVDRNFDNSSVAAIASFSSFFGLTLKVDDTSIINECTVRAKPRKIVFDVQTVGYITDPLFVGGNSSGGVNLEFVDPVSQERGVPVFALSSVQSTDYYISANPDLSGADLSSQCVLTVDPFARSARITLVNSGTSNVYLVNLTLRGSPATQAPEIHAITVNSPSQVLYQKRTQEVQADLLQTFSRIKNLSEYVVFKNSEISFDIELQIKNRWPFVCSLEINDHVWAQNSLLNVGSSFIIKEMDHSIAFDAGTEHVVSYTLESRLVKDWFTLDSSALGRLDINKLGF